MQKLIQGLHQFQHTTFPKRKAFFEGLASGQSPEALFITCSDSRINPNLITHTQPGELFIVRNAGNLVPPHGSPPGGEIATIEYAIAALKVRDVIVCGHTHCGAMRALLEPGDLTDLPQMAAWLGHADATRRILRDHYKHLDGEALLSAAVQENVLVQLEHLRTLPTVAAALAGDTVRLHGWVYKLETGQVFAFDPEARQFVPIDEIGAAGVGNHGRPAALRAI